MSSLFPCPRSGESLPASPRGRGRDERPDVVALLRFEGGAHRRGHGTGPAPVAIHLSATARPGRKRRRRNLSNGFLEHAGRKTESPVAPAPLRSPNARAPESEALSPLSDAHFGLLAQI